MILILTIRNPEALQEGTAAQYLMEGETAVLGRSATATGTCPIRATPFPLAIARSGATGDFFMLKDLCTNGTFVNDATERMDGEHFVNAGDLIRIGHYEVVASFETEVAPAAPDRAEPAVPEAAEPVAAEPRRSPPLQSRAGACRPEPAAEPAPGRAGATRQSQRRSAHGRTEPIPDAPEPALEPPGPPPGAGGKPPLRTARPSLPRPIVDPVMSGTACAAPTTPPAPQAPAERRGRGTRRRSRT